MVSDFVCSVRASIAPSIASSPRLTPVSRALAHPSPPTLSLARSLALSFSLSLALVRSLARSTLSVAHTTSHARTHRPAPHAVYSTGISSEWWYDAAKLIPKTAARITARSHKINTLEANVTSCVAEQNYDRAAAWQRELENEIDRLQISYTLATWVRHEISKENAALAHVEMQRDFVRSALLTDHIAKVVRWSEDGFGDLDTFPTYKFKTLMKECVQVTTRTVVQERASETFLIPLAQVISITISAATQEVIQREKVERRQLAVDKSIDVFAGDAIPEKAVHTMLCSTPMCWRWYCYPRCRTEQRLRCCCKWTLIIPCLCFAALLVLALIGAAVRHVTTAD